MTWTTPGYVASGEADSGKFNTETVDNLQYLYDEGAWDDYTPVVTQSGTVTKTITRARYTTGRTIRGDVLLTVSGAGGVAANQVRVTLPVVGEATSTNTVIGEGWIYDISASAYYFGTLFPGAVGSASFLRRTDGSGASVLGLSGFTAALDVGDVISFAFSYEAT